eukprot:gene5802-6242_t
MMEEVQKSSKRYLIIANVSKKHNVMNLVNAARAYDFCPIMVGGINLYNSLPEEFRHGLTWLESLNLLKEMMTKEHVSIVGIEICQESVNLLEFQLPENIAIMPGNEGTGLNKYQRQISDHLVYIPHYGEGTASLNVHIATSLVLHHYTSHIA